MPDAGDSEKDFWVAITTFGALFGTGLYALVEKEWWIGGFYTVGGAGGLVWMSPWARGLLNIRPSRTVLAAAIAATLFFLAANIGLSIYQQWGASTEAPANILNSKIQELQSGLSRTTATVPATAIPTSISLLFGNSESPPEILETKNIALRSFDYDSSFYATKPITIGSNLCPNGDIPDFRGCLMTMKKLILLLSFDKPITFKTLKIVPHGDEILPKWENKVMTQTYAALWFDSYPKGLVLDVEATN